MKERDGLKERQIELLERSQKSRPPFAASTITLGKNKKAKDTITLLVAGLYWGVRCMVERLTADKNRVDTAEQYLTKWKCLLR